MIAKKYRIERNLINYILEKGELYTSKLLIIRYLKNNKKFLRFCVIISKKITPKAIIRNKLKRQIYEAIRTNINELIHPEPIDVIIIPKKKILEAKFEEIEENIKRITTKPYGQI